jgi:hypothetical protein
MVIMIFVIVIATQCISPVISVTAVRGIGEKNIFVFIIAYPLTTAFGFNQLSALTAESTSWGTGIFIFLGFSNFPLLMCGRFFLCHSQPPANCYTIFLSYSSIFNIESSFW